MSKTENPTKCEVYGMIRFLNEKKCCLIEIHRQIMEVYGNDSTNEACVRKWLSSYGNMMDGSQWRQVVCSQ